MKITSRIVRKSSAWHWHGAHSKIDPHFTTKERRRIPTFTEWRGSVAELFRKRGRP